MQRLLPPVFMNSSNSRLFGWLPVPVAFVLVLVASFALLSFWAAQKEGLMIDEVWSFTLANGRMGLEIPETWFGHWLDTSNVQEAMKVAPGNTWDWAAPYVNQVADVHPPLYYYGVRLISTIFPHWDFQWLGIILNFVWFAVAEIFIFLIARKLLGTQTRALAVCLVFGLSAAAVSTITMIRMYTQLTAACAYMTWVGTKVLENRQNLRLSLLLLLFSAVFLGMSTQYYFLIYCFFTSAFLFLLLLWQRLWISALRYAATAFLGLFAFVAYFPAFIHHVFFSYRGNEALNNLEGSDTLFRVKSYASIIWTNLFSSPLLPWIALALLLCLALAFVPYVRKLSLRSQKISSPAKLQNGIAAMIACAALPTFALIAKISAYDEFRYVSFTFFGLVLLWAWLVFFMTDKLPALRNLCAGLALSPLVFSSIGYHNDLFMMPGDRSATEATREAAAAIVDRIGAPFYTPVQTLPHLLNARSMYFVPVSNTVDYPKLIDEGVQRAALLAIYTTGNDTQLVSYLQSSPFRETHQVKAVLGFAGTVVYLVKDKDGRTFPDELHENTRTEELPSAFGRWATTSSTNQ